MLASVVSVLLLGLFGASGSAAKPGSTKRLPKPGGILTRPLWVGGFENGTFGQWDQLDGDRVHSSRYFRILSRPRAVYEGRHSFQSIVDGSAIGRGEHGQRAMLLLFPSNIPWTSRTGAYEGSERWYRSHVYFPKSFRPSPNNRWNWLVQWHNWPDGLCCSNLALTVDTYHRAESLSMRVMGGGDGEHPIESYNVNEDRNPVGRYQWFVGDRKLKRKHWYNSLVHVKWSYQAHAGFVQWWLDGKLIMSKHMSTLYWYADNNRNFAGSTPGPGQAYYMEGYYRPTYLPDGSVDRSRTSVVFDGARIGLTRASVSR